MPASLAAEVPAELLACSEEPNDLRRLVCYDEAMRVLLEDSATGQDATPARAESPASANAGAITAATAPAEPTAAAKPGASAAVDTAAEVAAASAAAATRTAASGNEPAKPDVEERPKEQSYVVSEVIQQPRGEHTVVLENGEVWREPTASRYFPVKAGDRITLKKRIFGGYRLVTESGKGFSVTRIR